MGWEERICHRALEVFQAVGDTRSVLRFLKRLERLSRE
jgi:hypothetical protein